MININKLALGEFEKALKEGYRKNYGTWKTEYGDIVAWAGREMGSLVSSKCDALYHNLEHMIDVTLVGQEILLGQHKIERVQPEEWLNFMIACISHDIGYVKDLFENDDKRITSGASLTSEHVDRSKLFIEKRFEGNQIINAKKVSELIEYTRFPNKQENLSNNGKDKYGVLIRASDFIGQLSNLHYNGKNAVELYYEFEEIGTNKKLGYNNINEMRDKYPSFFLKIVYPMLSDAIKCLERNENGKQIMNNLYGNVKRAELEAVTV
jgi:hypothetical protein